MEFNAETMKAKTAQAIESQEKKREQDQAAEYQMLLENAEQEKEYIEGVVTSAAEEKYCTSINYTGQDYSKELRDILERWLQELGFNAEWDLQNAGSTLYIRWDNLRS